MPDRARPVLHPAQGRSLVFRVKHDERQGRTLQVQLVHDTVTRLAGQVDFAGGPLSLYDPVLTAQFVPFGGTGSPTQETVRSLPVSSIRA